MSDELISEIIFSAEKVYVHYWPPETPKWSDSRKSRVDEDINKNKEKKQVTIRGRHVQINDYLFTSIQKIGLTIPQFRRQCTMIFEGHCEEFYAHVHIATKSKDYLEVFNNLMMWRDRFFPDTPFLDSKN